MLKFTKALKRTMALGLIAVVGLPTNAFAEKLPFPEELSPQDAKMVAYGELLGREYFVAQAYTTITFKDGEEETVGNYYAKSEGKINGDWQYEYARPTGNGQFFNMPPEHHRYIDNLNYYDVYAFKKEDGTFDFQKSDKPSKFLINNLLAVEPYIAGGVWDEKGGTGSCDASGQDDRFKPHGCYIYRYSMPSPYGTKEIEFFLDKNTALLVHVNMFEKMTYDYGDGHVVTQTVDSKYYYDYPDKLEKPEFFKDYYLDKKDDSKKVETKVENNAANATKDNKESVSDKVTFKVKGHKIKNNKLTLKKGEKVKLKILNANGQKVTFKAKGKAIKVTKNGKITAKKKGSAKLIVKVGSKKYTLKIKVKK